MTIEAFDTIVTIKDWKVRMHSREFSATYHQNDTVVLIVNGKVEIIDKPAFRDMVTEAADSDNNLAKVLLMQITAS
jgi:EAL domain-containing protein (putative c-di-GMP-specific phosphodiesterase class I)